MAYSKCFNAQTLKECYGNFTKKKKSDCLDMMTCGFSKIKKKKDKNLDFTEIFSFLISNILVELLFGSQF